MGITWNLGALVGTVALVLIVGAIWNKMKSKEDSPLYKVMQRVKGFKKDPEDFNMVDSTKHYRRLSHSGGVKW